jgi:hypothetical protein
VRVIASVLTLSVMLRARLFVWHVSATRTLSHSAYEEAILALSAEIDRRLSFVRGDAAALDELRRAGGKWVGWGGGGWGCMCVCVCLHCTVLIRRAGVGEYEQFVVACIELLAQVRESRDVCVCSVTVVSSCLCDTVCARTQAATLYTVPIALAAQRRACVCVESVLSDAQRKGVSVCVCVCVCALCCMCTVTQTLAQWVQASSSSSSSNERAHALHDATLALRIAAALAEHYAAYVCCVLAVCGIV